MMSNAGPMLMTPSTDRKRRCGEDEMRVVTPTKRLGLETREESSRTPSVATLNKNSLGTTHLYTHTEEYREELT